MGREAITHSDLYANLGNAIIKVFSLEIIESANCHGEAHVISVMDMDFAQQVIDFNPFAVLLFYIDEKEKKQPLFAGIINNIQVDSQGEQCQLTVVAKAATTQMDTYSRQCSYQDVQVTPDELFRSVFAHGRYGQVISNIGAALVNRFFLQYEETDWEFLKRLASHYGTRIFPDNRDTVVMLQIGLPEENEAEVCLDDLPYKVHRDYESYRFLQMNYGDQVHNWDSIRYTVTTYELLRLGNRVNFKGGQYYVGDVVRQLYDGLLANQYTLYPAKGLWIPEFYNKKLKGVSVMGTVRDRQRDQVQVELWVDQGKLFGNYQWFFHSTVASFGNGNGWYAMPQKGEQVRVFFPDYREESGYAITCLGGGAVGGSAIQQDWNLQSIQGDNGEELTFSEEGVVMRVNKTEVELFTDGRVSFQHAATVKMNAGKMVVLNAGASMLVTSKREIRMTTKESHLFLTTDTLSLVGGQIFLNSPE